MLIMRPNDTKREVAFTRLEERGLIPLNRIHCERREVRAPKRSRLTVMLTSVL